MMTRFKNKYLLSVIVMSLLLTLLVTPVLARSDLATDENRAPNPPQNPDGSFPDGDSSEIPTAIGIPIYVPARPELGYNPAEQDGPAATQGNPKTGAVAVVVNGVAVYFPDQQPYIDAAGRTMIPVRFVSEALGAKVDADKDSVVTIERNDVVIKHKIGTNTMAVNGASKTCDTKSVLTKQYRTMVPLRFISEALGAKVSWNAETWAVAVADNE